MLSIVMKKDAYEQLLALCDQALPREACGVLTGEAAPSGCQVIVHAVHPITNVHEDPIRSFRFHPGEWVAAYYSMQKNRQSLVGFFHSHPHSPAIPSSRDLLGLPASNEWLSYWIVSMKEPSAPIVQPYLIDGQSFLPLKLMLT